MKSNFFIVKLYSISINYNNFSIRNNFFIFRCLKLNPTLPRFSRKGAKSHKNEEASLLVLRSWERRVWEVNTSQKTTNKHITRGSCTDIRILVWYRCGKWLRQKKGGLETMRWKKMEKASKFYGNHISMMCFNSEEK